MTNINWHLEKRKISDLKDHPKNPRQLSKEQATQLKESIEKFGLIDKPIITKDNLIIGGHQRKNILKTLKLKEVECWVPDRDMTEKEIDELNIRLNRNTGDWDYDVLANEWNVVDLIDWGFDPEELLGSTVEEILGEEEESQVLEPPKDPKTKLGDIYELNEHRIVCGDSTQPFYVDLCINGNEPILMITDPPYGVEYDPNFNKKEGQKKLGKVLNDDNANWALSYHLFTGSVAYVWSSDKFAFETVSSLIDADFQIICQIIWAKPSLVLGRGDYHSQHEPCWYAVKKGCTHNWKGDRKQNTLWEIEKVNKNSKNQDDRTDHGTQKPIECMARPIRNNTDAGEGVYDPFLGSGTTLIAAEQLGRTCYGIELSPSYCDIIVDRWTKYMKKNNKSFRIRLNGEEIEWNQKSQ